MTANTRAPSDLLMNLEPQDAGNNARGSAVWRNQLPAAVGGTGMALSFDPVGVAWLAPFALAAYVTSTGPQRQSWRRTGIAGFSFGAVFIAVHIWWLATPWPQYRGWR